MKNNNALLNFGMQLNCLVPKINARLLVEADKDWKLQNKHGTEGETTDQELTLSFTLNVWLTLSIPTV